MDTLLVEQPRSTIELSVNSIEFSHFSALDSFGRVFFWKDRVFRLVNPENASLCQDWFDSGLIAKLIAEKLIPKTEIKFEISLKEFPDHLILEHEKLVQSFIGEWTFSMIKNAAYIILRLNCVLNDYGYELKDAHPFNILFRGTEPLWIDLGSIQKKKGTHWNALNEYLSSFYIPLKLWEKGEVYIVNKILNDKWFPHHRFLPHQNLMDTSSARNLSLNILNKYIVFHTQKTSFRICKSFKHERLFISTLNRIARKLTGRKGSPISIRLELKEADIVLARIAAIQKCVLNSDWNDYHEKYYSDSLTERIDYIVNKVISLSPTSVLDLAGNQGLISSLIYEKTAQPKPLIINTDYDENALDFGYKKTERNNIGVNHILMNCILSGQRDITIYERYGSDVVLALAITHHLILGQGYTMEYILSVLKRFTKKYLFIEFMPLGLWSKGQAEPELPEWYTIEWFKSSLMQYFSIMSEEKLEDNRILFIVKRNNNVGGNIMGN